MTIRSVNPATGKTIAEFPSLDSRQLEERLRRAASAFGKHRKVPFAERSRHMREAAEILERRKDEFGRTMTLEMGKPIKAAIAEVQKCAMVCRYYADNAARFLADEPIATDARQSYVRYEPMGTVLAVMPWNFPFWQVFRFAAPALMAGNVGLLKHASNVPQSALFIEEIFREAGFLEGCFQTLLISADAVKAVLEDPRVKAVTLTGSEPAGASVGSIAAGRIKKSVLELGGSDPFIVMPSADLDNAVNVGVQARVVNNGQSCIAAKRFILHERIAEQFTTRFVARMKALRIGDPLDDATDIGPLAMPQIAEDLEKQVQDSVARGARLLLGGSRIDGPGNYFQPTVLVDIPRDAPAFGQETFGPVASLFRVKSVQEAIQQANGTDFGLGASVWTNDANEQAKFIDGLETGQVFVNAMVASDPRVPFGGVKHSGFGRELGIWGIREFVNVKTVWIAGETRGRESATE